MTRGAHRKPWKASDYVIIFEAGLRPRENMPSTQQDAATDGPASDASPSAAYSKGPNK